MTGPDKQPPTRGPKTISYTRVVSLSREIHPGIPLWPSDPQVEFEAVARLEADGYYLRRFAMGEHSGTHMNAPRSFYRNGPSIDDYAAESLVSPASVIDIREQVDADPDYALTLGDLEDWEGRHGPVPGGNMVLLHTGWQHRWGNPRKFLGLDDDGGFHFPGFGTSAARHLLMERNASGFGTDTPGVEPGTDKEFSVNKLALERHRIVLENLANLDQLPASGATLVIGVLLLSGGTGSPWASISSKQHFAASCM